MTVRLASLPHQPWPLVVGLAIALAVAATPHLASDAEPQAAPEAPGCIGCHHGAAEPEPGPGLTPAQSAALNALFR